MRRWTYTYRTSDGQRHSDEIEAESLDAAHAAIRREMGVKPIKVWAAGGSKANGAEADSKRTTARWVAATALVAVAIAGGAWWITARNGPAGGRAVSTEPPKPPESPAAPHATVSVLPSRAAADPKRLEGYSAAYREIAVEVDAACEAYRDESARIDFELLANYALVERTRDMAEFRAIIAHGREVVSRARDAVRRSIEAHYEDIPPSGADDRNEAQRLYGLVMDELDATDERLESDECALSLLDANRGKWRVVKGAVIWDDPRLERQFRIFGREPSAAATRWERDFGRGRIESAPVALPSAPAAK